MENLIFDIMVLIVLCIFIYIILKLLEKIGNLRFENIKLLQRNTLLRLQILHLQNKLKENTTKK